MAVAATLALLSLTPAAVSMPAAADERAAFDVTITDLSTPVVDPRQGDEVIELRGTIENVSDEAVRYLSVNFWSSSQPLTTRDELQVALASAPTEPLGERIQPPTIESGHVEVIAQEDDFAPGEQAEFTVSATVAELGLADDPAAYLVGVHVRGVPASGGNQTLGRGRVLLTASPEPLRAAAVVELSATPTLMAGGEFRDDSLVTDIDARLSDLLDAARDLDATVLLDPLLLLEADALARPHIMAGEDHEAHPAAQQFVDALRQLIDAGKVMRLPLADVDVPRASAADRLDLLLDWAAAESAELPDVAGLPLAADLDDRGTRALVSQLTSAGVGRVFVANATGSGSGVGGVVVTEPLDLPGLASSPDSALQRHTRQWAEDVVATTPRVHLADDADDVAGLRALDSQRAWTSVPRSGGAVLFSPPTATTDWEEWGERFEEVLDQAEFAQDLTGSDLSVLMRHVLLRSASEGFGSEAAAVDWITDHPSLAPDPSGVRVSAAGSFVMGSRTSDFPVTLTNELAVPVTARLVFDSEFPQRIDVPATDLVTVQPGQNLTLNVSPEATANGVARVTARLQTAGGHTFGEPVDMEITATEFGRVGWIIIVVSGAVVLGGTVMRIRAVQKERAGENSGG